MFAKKKKSRWNSGGRVAKGTLLYLKRKINRKFQKKKKWNLMTS